MKKCHTRRTSCPSRCSLAPRAVGGFGVATWLIWDTMNEYEVLKSKGVISFRPVEGIITNWSATHEIETTLYQPESEDDLIDLVQESHVASQRVRWTCCIFLLFIQCSESEI